MHTMQIYESAFDLSSVEAITVHCDKNDLIDFD